MLQVGQQIRASHLLPAIKVKDYHVLRCIRPYLQAEDIQLSFLGIHDPISDLKWSLVFRTTDVGKKCIVDHLPNERHIVTVEQSKYMTDYLSSNVWKNIWSPTVQSSAFFGHGNFYYVRRRFIIRPFHSTFPTNASSSLTGPGPGPTIMIRHRILLMVIDLLFFTSSLIKSSSRCPK